MSKLQVRRGLHVCLQIMGMCEFFGMNPFTFITAYIELPAKGFCEVSVMEQTETKDSKYNEVEISQYKVIYKTT